MICFFARFLLCGALAAAAAHNPPKKKRTNQLNQLLAVWAALEGNKKYIITIRAIKQAILINLHFTYFWIIKIDRATMIEVFIKILRVDRSWPASSGFNPVVVFETLNLSNNYKRYYISDYESSYCYRIFLIPSAERLVFPFHQQFICFHSHFSNMNLVDSISLLK